MMKELILIRHTKSSRSDLSLPDFDRPLKQDRIDDAKNMASKVKELGLQPGLIICSPALRTKQTAEYFCGKLKYDYDKIYFDKRLYESSAHEYMEVIGETGSKVQSLVVIGHNPSITDLSNIFLDDKITELPTTGVVWLQFERNDWNIGFRSTGRLRQFLTPKSL